MKKGEVKMLSVREVSEKLKAGQSSVRMWCVQGKFPNAEQLDTPRGPVWLVPETDLIGFEKRDPGRPPKAKAEGSEAGKKRGRK